MKRPTLQGVAVAILAAAGILLHYLAYLLAFILAVAGVKPALAEARAMPYSFAQPEADVCAAQVQLSAAQAQLSAAQAQLIRRHVFGIIPARPDYADADDDRFDAAFNDVNAEALTAAQRNPQPGGRS